MVNGEYKTTKVVGAVWIVKFLYLNESYLDFINFSPKHRGHWRGRKPNSQKTSQDYNEDKKEKEKKDNSYFIYI